MTFIDTSAVRVTVVQNDPAVPLDAWRSALGVRADVVRAYADEPLPADLGDGLIVLGAGFSAYSDDRAPWLGGLRALLREAIDAHLPTLGICFGAQLLATACGGSVAVSAPPGREAGVTRAFWRPAARLDPVLGPLAANAGRGSTCFYSMHSDAVVDLPQTATWLASSNMYPFQAFRIGSALGVQFHPEASRETVTGWLRDEPGPDGPDALETVAAHADEADRAGSALASAFAAHVAERSRLVRHTA